MEPRPPQAPAAAAVPASQGAPLAPLDTFWAALVIAIWGLNFVAAKIGLAQIPPLLMMALRFALVALLLVPFLRIQWGRMGRLAVISAVLGLHYSLMFIGLNGVTAGAASIAAQLMVPFSAALAWVFFRERMAPRQMVGMAVAFVGVYVLGGDPAAAPELPYLLSVVASAFALALAVALIKRLGPMSLFTLNAWVSLLSAPQLMLASLAFEDDHMQVLAVADWRGWGAVVFMATLVTIVSHGLYYHLVRKYDLNRVVPLTLLTPVAAVALAVAILDETLTARLIIGGMLTVVGVAMIQFTFRWLRRRGAPS